jgi:hypothetical protein
MRVDRHAVTRCGAATQAYGVEVSEHTNTRVLPEALVGVLTLDEYQARAAACARSSSRRAS